MPGSRRSGACANVRAELECLGTLPGAALNGSINYLLNVLANGASRVLGMGAGFFCFVLFARVLGSEALGQLAFVMAFVMIAGNVADFGTNTALAKSLAEHRERDPSAWFGNYLLVRAALAALTVVLGVLVSCIVGGELLDALLLGCLATPFMAARFFESLFQIYERPQYSVYTALMLGVCQVALASGFLLLGAGLTGYMIAFATSQLIYFVFALWLSRSLVIPRMSWRPEFSAALFRLAMPMGVSALAMAMYSRADVFLLTHWRSTEEVGLYNASYRLLDLSIAVAVTVALPLVPILTRRLQHSREDARVLSSELMGFAATALLPVAILTAALADVILAVVYGVAFTPSVPVLHIFAWLFMATGYSMIASSINLAAGNMRYNYWLYPLAGAVNIGINCYLIPRHGIVGAALATGASTLVIVVGVLWNVHRSVGNIHRAGPWLKLLFCGMVLHLGVQWARDAAPAGPPALIAVCGIVVYASLAWMLGLVPTDRLRELLAARRALR